MKRNQENKATRPGSPFPCISPSMSAPALYLCIRERVAPDSASQILLTAPSSTKPPRFWKTPCSIAISSVFHCCRVIGFTLTFGFSCFGCFSTELDWTCLTLSCRSRLSFLGSSLRFGRSKFHASREAKKSWEPFVIQLLEAVLKTKV